VGRTGVRRRDESGASAVELVLYMPILMFTILFAVQFCLIYLGGQVASGAAREGARTARVTGSGAAGQSSSERVVRQLGAGVLNDATVHSTVADDRARVTVSGEASTLLPFLPVPRISETVEGPVERFVPDDGAKP
jgi:Flp pilus assembly protein TadG